MLCSTNLDCISKLLDLENLAKAAKLDEEGDGSLEHNLRERFILGLKSTQAQTAVVRYLAEEEAKLGEILYQITFHHFRLERL